MGVTGESEVCFMNLDEFKRKSAILNMKLADEIRKRYIETFVTVHSNGRLL